MGNKYRYSIISILLIITCAAIYFNASDISRGYAKNRKPNLNKFLKRIKNVPDRWKKRLDKINDVANYEVYKLKIPSGWYPSDQYKHIEAHLLGEKINIYRQVATQPSPGSYFFNGEVLRSEKGKERSRYGNVSVTFHKNHAAGEIYIGSRYAKIVTLEPNIIALAEFKKVPEYICGINDNSKNNPESNNNKEIGIIIPDNFLNNSPQTPNDSNNENLNQPSSDLNGSNSIESNNLEPNNLNPSINNRNNFR